MELKNVLEAILFSAQKPLTVKELVAICADAGKHGRRKFTKAKPREIFDYLYVDTPDVLHRQKAEYFKRLDRKGVE